MKIAICDDDESIRVQLHQFIQQYAIDSALDYTTLELSQSMLLLDTARQDPNTRIMSLDIYMSPLSGMDLAETIRVEGNGCVIVFVTISRDHYSRSYEMDTEHYLVKPVTYEQVEKVLKRCERLLISAARCAFFFSNGHEIKVSLRNIRFAEVFRDQTIIHASADIVLCCPLMNVMGQLSNSCFLRTHRSSTLNMDFIASKGGNDILLITGEEIPLSRTREKIFSKEYGQYLTASMAGDE